MLNRPLPRSFKRKYKKIHSEFSKTQAIANVLQAELDASVATALKLTSDTDYLLQLLSEIVPPKNPQDIVTQLEREDLKDDETILDDAGSELADDYYSVEAIPGFFSSLPWNLDLNSFSGSHLEDIERAANAAITGQTLQYTESKVSTPAVPSSKKPRSQGSKKRERGEHDDEATPSVKKKKRKSLLFNSVS